jgi:protoporphyrinogen oxidase
VLRKVVRRRPGPGRTFLYPRRGFGQIAECLADAAVAAGVDLRLGAPVTGVHLGSPHRIAVRADPPIDARTVLSTLPLAALAHLADPAPPPAVLAAATRLDHRAMVLLYLVVDRPRFTEYDAHYLPSTTDPTSRLSEPKNYRTSAADPADLTVLCAEVPCWEGDATWTASADVLGEQVRAALVADGLPDPRPVGYEVRRLPRVYPLFRLGFASHQRAVEQWLDGVDGVLSLGRQGLFVGDNTHHVLATGWDAAASLRPDATIDRAAWRRARVAFASHVVED